MNAFICSAFAFLSLTSCNFANQVVGNEYQLVSPKYSMTVTLGFNNDGKFYGKALNRYFGSYEAGEKTIKFSNMGTTLMAGTPEDMQTEREYLKNLNEEVSYTLSGNKITLKTKSGQKYSYKKIKK